MVRTQAITTNVARLLTRSINEHEASNLVRRHGNKTRTRRHYEHHHKRMQPAPIPFAWWTGASHIHFGWCLSMFNVIRLIMAASYTTRADPSTTCTQQHWLCPRDCPICMTSDTFRCPSTAVAAVAEIQNKKTKKPTWWCGDAQKNGIKAVDKRQTPNTSHALTLSFDCFNFCCWRSLFLSLALHTQTIYVNLVYKRAKKR